jgi:hypothetical protein
MGFMARLKYDQSISPKAIASNEYCAVTINEDGIARAWGEFPEYDDDYVYFLQENPANTMGPEVMEQDIPLTWNRDEEAVKVYKVPGTVSGENYFDLNNWTTGEGGNWENWWVDNGELFMSAGEPLQLTEIDAEEFSIYPNPASDVINLSLEYSWTQGQYRIVDATGRTEKSGSLTGLSKIDVASLPEGFHLIILGDANRTVVSRFVKTR